MTQRFDLHGQEAYAIGAKEEMEQCCKDICTFCKNGDIPWKHGGELQGYQWFHNDPNGYFIEPGIRATAHCKASAIRQRWENYKAKLNSQSR
jgi:hypothetical protein